LVENCFKHSHIDTDPNGFIRLYIRQVGYHLSFVAENSVQSGHDTSDERERTGIGVSNVRRRLEGLYAGRYRMKESDGGQTYRVEMELDLDE
jgi:LytS/YehU family sensor histidine kinase